MKVITAVLVIFMIPGCSAKRMYSLHSIDKKVNYKGYQMSINLISDSSGIFACSGKSAFNFRQKFNYKNANQNYLVVTHANAIDRDDIASLKEGDTLVLYKKRIYFTYRGKYNQLLTFRRTL